jgi:DNA invertase Pin-like site-specific DNA recombinase
MGRRAKQQQGDANKAVVYVRVSTEDQQLGPQAQLAAIQRYCDAKGIQIMSVHTDHGVSGAAEIDRCPALLDAIDAMKATGAALLIAAKRDRVARDVMKAAMVEQLVQRAGGMVVSAAGEGEGTDAASQLMRTLVDAFAAYERALIAQRTTAALAVKKAKGQRTGGVPWGFDANPSGQLVANDEEVSLIQRCRSLRARGMKLREIATQLNQEGVTLRGRQLYEMKVHRLLQRVA